MIDLLDRALDAMGIGRVTQWPVRRGNDIVIMDFLARKVLIAKVGDRIRVAGGGFVQKITDQSWVQWAFFRDDDPAAPPLTGKVLQSRPVAPPAP